MFCANQIHTFKSAWLLFTANLMAASPPAGYDECSLTKSLEKTAAEGMVRQSARALPTFA